MPLADDTVLLAESEADLQRVVNEFYSVCKIRKLKVNAGKSKVMVSSPSCSHLLLLFSDLYSLYCYPP